MDNLSLKPDDAAQVVATTPTNTALPDTKPKSRVKLIRVGLVVAIVIAASLFGWPWLVERFTHVSVNDARIAANLVTISSEVSGRITQIEVIAGDPVKKGQLLVAIDTDQPTLEIKALDAQLQGIEAQQAQYRSEQELIRAQVSAKLAAGQTQVVASEATHRGNVATVASARSKFERVRSLAQSNVMSAQVLEEAQAALLTAEEQERATAAAIETAKANIEVTRSDQAQVDVLDKQIVALDAQKSALEAEREQKRVDLGKREIRAQFDGVVDSTFVDAGEYAAPGTRLLIYHDPSVVWVDANVKETDFGRIKLGAPTTVSVDAYPDAQMTGKVTRLGEAATSQFALLPSPNPSGNFTKITQRLPIRVAVDQSAGLLKPGMMVELSIDVLD